MVAFTLTEWAILAMVFVLGLLVGMYFMAGGKWKKRYKEEARLRAEDQKRLHNLESERKHAEARNIAAHARDDRPLTDSRP